MYTILIVEDEEVIRKGIIMSIDFLKLDCVLIGEATNGKEGAALIMEKKPNIVITDVTMPFMNGIEMIEKTLDCGYTSIIISGYNEFSYAKKAIRLGVCDYLLKPIDKTELNEVIAQVIQQMESLKYYKKVMKKRGETVDIQVFDTMDTKDELVSAMMEYVKKHYHEKLAMLDIAKHLNYSESLLSKRFRRYANITFIDYVNRFRVQKAMDFMKTETHSMYDISEICGFSDYKYFSVVFKKYTGCSPKQFIDIVSSKKTKDY